MIIRKRGFSSDLDYIFGDLFQTPIADRRNSHKLIKIKEDSGDKYVMALPGLQKTDLKISVENNVLSVSYDLSENDESIFIAETFSEKILLSNNVNIDKITSELRDGILTIKIPRVNEVKKIRSIEIR